MVSFFSFSTVCFMIGKASCLDVQWIRLTYSHFEVILHISQPYLMFELSWSNSALLEFLLKDISKIEDSVVPWSWWYIFIFNLLFQNSYTIYADVKWLHYYINWKISSTIYSFILVQPDFIWGKFFLFCKCPLNLTFKSLSQVLFNQACIPAFKTFALVP